MSDTLSRKEAHGSVYTLFRVGDVHIVRRQAINTKTGKPWRRLWTVARFEGDNAGFKALSAFNRAIKTGEKGN